LSTSTGGFGVARTLVVIGGSAKDRALRRERGPLRLIQLAYCSVQTFTDFMPVSAGTLARHWGYAGISGQPANSSAKVAAVHPN
jgi:hypothetical protein